MSSDSEPELFITQAVLAEVLQLRFRETILNLPLWVQSERAVYNFNFRTEDLLTDLFIDKEDFGWGITTVTTKKI